ncbi:TrmH family RNA methyltransferase, partial [Aciditerrimonas ferrireducens]
MEGRQAVLALLQAGRRRVQRVLLAEQQEPAPILDEIERWCRQRRVPVELVSAGRLAQLASTQQPQGVLAYAEAVPEVDLDELVADERALLVVLDGVTDPQNVGSLARSAACLGASGLVLPRHRSGELTPSVMKVAAGGLEHLAVCRVPGVPAALARLEQLGCRTLGLSERAERSLYDVEDEVFEGPLALVLGAEGSGLRRLSAARCHELVRIPLAGALPALNVAVAGEEALAEAARRRG